MIKTTVFMVTRLGEALLAKPQGRITGDARLLAGLIDGKASIAEIADKVPPSVRVHLADIFTRLLNYGVIAEKGGDGSGHELLNPQQFVEEPPGQAKPGGQRLNKQALPLNNSDVENKRRIELEKELSEVRLKLDSTIGRQKKVEQDYLKLIEQVSAYAQGSQAKSGKPQDPPAQPNAAYAEDGLRGSLDNISQLNQALLEQQEILSNTLKLRAYQAQLRTAKLHEERETDGAKLALTHPRYKLLRGLEFFKGFSNAELFDFMKVAKWQEAEAGETILSEGEVGMSFYIVVSGSVNILRKGKRLASLERGDFFGEFAYLSGEAPVRSAHAVAATACELLAVDPLDIEFSTVQLRLRVVEALLRGQVRRMLLSDQRIDKLSGYLDRSHEPR